jgi:hypothetical protein
MAMNVCLVRHSMLRFARNPLANQNEIMLASDSKYWKQRTAVPLGEAGVKIKIAEFYDERCLISAHSDQTG